MSLLVVKVEYLSCSILISSSLLCLCCRIGQKKVCVGPMVRGGDSGDGGGI